MSLSFLFAKRRICIAALIVFLAVDGLSVCSAHDVPANWKTDCVGRMQISLPDQADVAAVTPHGLDELHSGISAFGYYFADGQRVGFTELSFYGLVAITRPLTSEEMRAVRGGVDSEQKIIKQNFGSQTKKKGNRNLLKELSVSPQEGVGWSVSLPSGVGANESDRMHLRLFLGDQFFSWDVSVAKERRLEMEKAFNTTVLGLSRRDNFKFSTERGVCLPYAFIQDDGTSKHYMSTVYRLQTHPDVTVWLKAGGAVESPNTTKKEAIVEANNFWTQYYQARKSVESLLHGSHNDIKFAGQKGIESMVKLIRDDDTEDYGYMAVMHGDPDVKVDTSDVMMYVIRDAKNAKTKGIEPIGKDEFFKLAQTIAASVKHRPVSTAVVKP